MVGIVGLEPTHFAAPEPKSGASTNFAISRVLDLVPGVGIEPT